jgi:glycosyltransferase involved in cell wall biosynthesis
MPSQTRPRLAVVVANGITGDSRVQKSAIAAARDGWDVVLVGRASGTRIERTTMGPIRVVRVPVRDRFSTHLRLRATHGLRRHLTQFGIPDHDALTRYRAVHNAWVLRQTVELTLPGGAALLTRPVRKSMIHLRRLVCDLRGRAWGWEQSRRPPAARPTGDWRRDWPTLVDVDIAFIPVLDRLQPDVIHANDITMIGTVAQAVARMRVRGRRVAWLYDAHEYVRGVDWPCPAQASAYPALEREFIARADAVVTVSPQIADLLRADYRLPETPLVVRNTPIQETVGAADGRPSVRDAAGLPAGVPLLVYSGWLAAERGLGTAIRALPKLPGVHLAIVAAQTSTELASLLSRADQLGVRSRVHVVPYVPQHRVPDYLSSADLGLICSLRTLNYELSLPTKLAEYLHGGVPVVASDVRTLRAFVEEHGVGEVFRADDAGSFATTVTRALARRAELAARITEPLLCELSWEEQSQGLVRLYRRIAPRVPATTCPDIPWTVEEPQAAPPPDHADAPARRRWRPLTATRVRLGVGPANYAGQAAGFAYAVCAADPQVSAEVFTYRSGGSFGYPSDVYLDAARLRAADLQADQVKRIVGRYTHLIADGFQPVYGYLNGDHIGADLPALAAAGIKVALLAHGSEVRHPARHLERHEFSLFRDAPEGMAETLTGIAERNRRVAEESGLPVYVTTPDLLDDLPWARWAPLVVDVDAWACDRPVMERRRPVVVHAPSRRWTKGTDRILPTLRDLHARGTIELRLAEKLAWAQMRELVQDADVVVDQVTTGAYGALSCEAMAAGRPAVAYLSDSLRQVIGPDLPIVNATPDTLRGVLEELVEDRDRTAKIGMESAEFARAYHGGAWTARAFGDFLA